MKQIIIKTDKLANIGELSYEERGKLLTMLLTMGLDKPNDEQVKELNSLYTEFLGDRFLRMAFLPFKVDFDEDKAKYEKIVARNQSNGKKGGRPRKNPITQSVLKPTQSVDSEPTKTSIIGLSTINLNNNISLEKEEEKEFGSRRPSAPTLDDVLAAANTMMITQDVATRFFYYYDALGWMMGDRPIVNWKSKLMEWKNNPKTFNNASTHDNHQQLIDGRTEALKSATLSAVESSARGDTEEFDYNVL